MLNPAGQIEYNSGREWMDFEELGSAVINKQPGATEDDVNIPDNALTLRERFRRTMSFHEVEKRPNFEFGYWERTLEVWREQGLPEDVVDEATAYDYFGIEDTAMVFCNPNPMPVCEHEVLEETDDYDIYRDSYGCVAQINKHGDRSIPHFLEYPIKDRESWQPFKEALDPDHPDRFEHLEESLEKLEGTSAPVGIFGGSLVGLARNLIGFEHIAMMAYEDPDLLAEIIDTFGQCVCTTLERTLPRTPIDFAMGWEDICFNQGPIVPPDFFRSVVGPWYRKISDLLVAHGCCVYTTDTDGNIWPIVDTFLDNGLTTMFPIEVHAGTDPCALREKYGKRVKLWGGVCKMRLAESKEAIEKELLRLKPYVEQGAFIPTVDHRVPANVSLENYLFYLDKKRELFNLGGTPKY